MAIISYELAKELKDAGFVFRNPMPYEPVVIFDGFCYAEPTLSELIDSCGLDFRGLHSPQSIGWARGDIWCAGDCAGNLYEGATREEAVARLRLALYGNSKKD